MECGGHASCILQKQIGRHQEVESLTRSSMWITNQITEADAAWLLLAVMVFKIIESVHGV